MAEMESLIKLSIQRCIALYIEAMVNGKLIPKTAVDKVDSCFFTYFCNTQRRINSRIRYAIIYLFLNFIFLE